MGKTNTWESNLLQLVFNNTAESSIGGTGLPATTPSAGSLYVSLHTADPTASGNQSSNEATYTGYARVAVARSTSGWTVSGSNPTQAANTSTVTFPQCTGGSNVILYVGVGTNSTGTGKLLYSGALASSLSVSNNITPSFSSGALVITES
jgi:hypothetical protein